MNSFTPATFGSNFTRSELVRISTLAKQPRDGTDYSTPDHRRMREIIAVNVHLSMPPLTGVFPRAHT